ncbi:hypothetical protein [Pseudoalteromonas sp. C8]|uniref:hypothetical protein n=1 Tax=Pseudoalteromonas sp. C8 TaxID=2686345 RepID=UPI0013FDBCDB|nr:hypothetical protein [Pseudoalteromonas sp. C8]
MSNNTLSIDSLFDMDDLFGSAAAYEATLDATETPTAEKVRIRAYSSEYYTWIGQCIPMPAKSPKINAVDQIVTSAKGTACKRCNATGIFALNNGTATTCYKCAGSGTITAIDEARTAKYWARKNSGQAMSKHYTDYVH